MSNVGQVLLLDAIEDMEMVSFRDVLTAVAHEIKVNAHQDSTQQEWVDAQAFDVAEEAGEFIGEYRRYRGFARRAGDREEMLTELADVIIASMIMFWNLNADPEKYVREKLKEIVTRGYVNKETT